MKERKTWNEYEYVQKCMSTALYFRVEWPKMCVHVCECERNMLADANPQRFFCVCVGMCVAECSGYMFCYEL